MIKIAPSILSADFAYLADEIKKVTDAGAEYIHLDIMDGQFVPNITFGSPVVAALRKTTKAVFDVHLMVEQPENQIEPFLEAGADLICFHAETAKHMHRIVQTIKAGGAKAAVALNPGTSLSVIEEILPELDMVLLMTVNPGFGGQKFIPSVLDKIERLRAIIDGNDFNIDIQVDGGINTETAKLVIAAGANILVAGSAVYGAENPAAVIAALRG
ncbi:MAG: ribulose-phosphate 3-epimerase [Selenomonadaceae bacterium]|jgi:ribulose-phosphate 3-epimerase